MKVIRFILTKYSVISHRLEQKAYNDRVTLESSKGTFALRAQVSFTEQGCEVTSISQDHQQSQREEE